MIYDPFIRSPAGRLILRPTVPGDVDRALEIRSNPAVAFNLVSATIPPDTRKMTDWFAGHADEWRAATAYRFAIDLDGHSIGFCDVFDIADSQGEIGYWLDQAVWGFGFGSDAATRLVRFGLKDVGLRLIRAGCADDNAASAEILKQLGFERLEDVRVFSTSRQTEITQRRFQLVA